MRARMAVMASGLTVGLREILLRDKPAAFRAVSSKATVPVLELDDGIILDESRDIMFWALDTSGDPAGWLECYHRDKQAVIAFLDQLEGPFKTALDKYKYATRYRTEEGAPIDGLVYRAAGVDGGFSWPDGASGGETGIDIIPCRPVVTWILLGGS